MAQIRFVDVWLRSPGASPITLRSVMVITEKWAEQRVLMRAFADSRDQTRPMITLHAVELAIGPAGIDVRGPWGIHVGEGPEGRAQEIKDQLEAAARRLAGSKGNPPRLVDEESTFERVPTANWGPGAPRIAPKRPDTNRDPELTIVERPGAARLPTAPAATPVDRNAPKPRRSGRTRPPPISGRTALGYQSGSGAQSAVVRLGLTPQVSARLGRLVDCVVGHDFQLDAKERRVLNALGEGELTAHGIGQMIDVSDAVTWMEDLTRKLEDHGLDLVEPGEPQGSEPTYRLRR